MALSLVKVVKCLAMHPWHAAPTNVEALPLVHGLGLHDYLTAPAQIRLAERP